MIMKEITAQTTAANQNNEEPEGQEIYSSQINVREPWKSIVVVRGTKTSELIRKLGEMAREIDKEEGNRDYCFSGPGGGINH
jgi:hypothetical protein